MHGIKRGGDNPTRVFYEALPEDDPHHLNPKKEKKSEQIALPLFEETTE